LNIPAKTTEFVSDNGAIRWNVSQPGHGYFVADTPRTKFFTGFVAGKTFKLGNVALDLGKTRLDWATVSLTCLDGKGFDQPGRILVAATGWRQNTDWDLEELGDDRITLGNRWGREPVLCEGVPASIVLPVAADRVDCYALDELGNRSTPAPPEPAGKQARVKLDPQYQTLWYEVVVK
jgi:hypothetical protein